MYLWGGYPSVMTMHVTQTENTLRWSKGADFVAVDQRMLLGYLIET